MEGSATDQLRDCVTVLLARPTLASCLKDSISRMQRDKKAAIKSRHDILSNLQYPPTFCQDYGKLV